MGQSGNTVQQFMQAVNQENWSEAEALLTPDFKFVGVMGSRDGASVYIQDLSRMNLKYKQHRIFENGDDVAVLCDYLMEDNSIFGCSWYQLKDGKIHLLRVVFDPRPLLEGKAGN